MSGPRLAAAIVRLYPRTWRARYEREVLALIEDDRATAWQALDLVRGCASEWMVAWFRPPYASPVLRAVVFVVGAALSYLLADRIAAVWPVAPPTSRNLGNGPLLLIAILEWRLLCLTALPRPIWKSLHSRLRLPQPPELELWVLTVCGFSAALIDQWRLQSGDGFSPIGAFICGHIALAWAFRRSSATYDSKAMR